MTFKSPWIWICATGEELGHLSPIPHPTAPISWLGRVENFMCPFFSIFSMEGTIADLCHSNLECMHPSEIPLGVNWVYSLGALIYPKVNFL